MPLQLGDKLGPYEILARIGAGGMGEVYRARDPRLNRDVAIKILPHDKTGDEDRKRRFIQEAKAASAMNHPNIVTIYDIGSENGVDFLVMELVAGKSLDQLIPRAGMRLSEILRAAVQIADAFSKAHAAGIVHRDLKPANVMLTPEGQVKILDFGLAKLTQSPSSESDATRTIAAHTGEGTVLGTTAYMSPEQAEGKPVDARSDIFAFGSLLYEISTGQRAFCGDTQMSTISAILRDDPKPASEYRGDIPAQFVRVITRCLRKDPARRFQHMADLKVELEELKEEADSGSLTAPAAAPPAKRSLPVWRVAAVAAILLAAAVVIWRFMPFAGMPAQETINHPIPLTSYTGSQTRPTFSPDASQVAFEWEGPQEDNVDIYVKLIGSGSPLRLTTDPAPDVYPQWSPDGKQIAFLRMGVGNGPAGLGSHFDSTTFSVIVIPALGGPERRVGTFANHAISAGLSVAGLCWTADSNALVVSAAESQGRSNGLFLVPLDGGPSKSLTRPSPDESDDTRPQMSGDGRQLIFLRTNGETGTVVLLPLSPSLEPQGEPKPIPLSEPSVASAAWLPGDREILIAAPQQPVNGRLYRTLLDPGAELRPLPGIGSAAYFPAVRGTRLAYSAVVEDSNFWAVDLTTRKAEMDRSLSSLFRDVHPQFSPDGKRVTLYSYRGGSAQVWVANRDGSQAAALTSMAGPTTGSPRWSPDGQYICFDSNTGGAWHVYVIASDGGQPRQVSSRVGYSSSWSHDGRWIYFASSSSPGEDVWKAPASGGDAQQVTHKGGAGPLESPDGKTLYFVKSGGLWKMPVEGGQEKQVLADVYRDNHAVTNKGIYFTPRSRCGYCPGGSQNGPDESSAVEFLDLATGKMMKIVKITKALDLGLTISPDERTLLYTQFDSTGANLMLVDKFH